MAMRDESMVKLCGLDLKSVLAVSRAKDAEFNRSEPLDHSKPNEVDMVRMCGLDIKSVFDRAREADDDHLWRP